jgi:hypothetical protein
MPAFAMLCDAVARQREAAAIVARDGVLIRGYRGDGLVKNPAVQLARDYAATAARLMARFAMTPADCSSGSSGSEGSSGSSSSSSGSGSAAAVDVVIRLSDPAAAATTFDWAPVQVSITTGTVRDALVVPIDALLAQPGGYAVEVADAGGTRHVVSVSLGLFDDAAGLVQVTGKGLAAGQQVVVPTI